MKIVALALTAFFVASPNLPPSDADGEAPFVASPRSFADEAACIAELAAFVASSRGFDAAVGPYRIARGDTRAHRVKAEAWAHLIEEQRCLGAALSSRRWTHAMSDVKPITMDDIEKMSFPNSLSRN